MRLEFLSLPCGCITSAGHLWVYFSAVECPWCAATFELAEFNEWVEETTINMLRFIRSFPLVRFGVVLLEVMGQCECGTPLVRPRGIRNAVGHFNAPTEMIEILRN